MPWASPCAGDAQLEGKENIAEDQEAAELPVMFVTPEGAPQHQRSEN